MTGILVMDKPADWTSHDVVARLRGLLKEKRIGHGGTLDPMATGVLPVFIGRATRAVEFCDSYDKEYVAGLRLGLETDTQDTTGTVLRTSEVTVKRQELEEMLSRFTGPQEQLPPMYSAVKIGGRKLYELARRGEVAERTPRHITVSAMELLETAGSDAAIRDAVIRVVCSKGTYIRTLCHDIGLSLGCGGTMYSLRRTRVGSFILRDAATLSDVEAACRSGGVQALLRPTDTVFADYPPVTADGGQRVNIFNGADFTADARDGLYRVYDEDGAFLMLGRADGGRMRTVKSFFDV